MEPSVLSVYMVSSDSLALIQVQGIAGPEGSRGLNCVMEVSDVNVCACERNKWEKVSMVSCVPLVLMEDQGTTGPAFQRCQLSPNNYLRTINDHIIQAVPVVYCLFRNSQSLRYIAIPFSEITIEITFQFFWCWLFERSSPNLSISAMSLLKYSDNLETKP